MTAPARATLAAAAVRRASRARIASSTVSGTSARADLSAPARVEDAAQDASSSSTWRGMPSVRSWIASATSRGRRQARAGEQGRHRRRVRRGQSVEPDFLGLPPGEQPRTPFAHRGSREELVAAVRPDDEQPVRPARVGPAPRGSRGSGRRSSAGPRAPGRSGRRRPGRPGARRRRGRAAGGGAAGRRGGGPCVGRAWAPRPPGVGEPGPELGERGLPLHRAGEVDEDRGRDLDVARVGAAADRPESGGLRTPLHRAQEPGLADAGLAARAGGSAPSRPRPRRSADRPAPGGRHARRGPDRRAVVGRPRRKCR